MAEDSGDSELKDLTATSFGLIIAYLLPGFVGLYGFRVLVPGNQHHIQYVSYFYREYFPASLLWVVSFSGQLKIRPRSKSISLHRLRGYRSSILSSLLENMDLLCDEGFTDIDWRD